MDDYLATLGKKERHEIRRKVRRAEAVGEIRLDDSRRPARGPRGVHRPAPEALGRRRAVPADRRRRPEPRALPSPVRAVGLGRAAAPHVPDRRRPADRGRRPLRDARTAISTTTPASIRMPATSRRASSWSMPTSSGRWRPGSPRSTSSAATSRTSTSGARSTSPSSACWFDVGTGEMTAPLPTDPCFEPVLRPALPGGRVRVVEVLATGTNGGAQEHLYSLVTRIDRSRYDVSVVALSAGSAVRKLQRAGIPGPRHRRARRRHRGRRARRAPRRGPRRRRPHAHVPRRDRRDARGAGPRRDRPPSAVPRLDDPLEPDPLERGPAGPARADPAHGPAHRGLAGHRAQARRRGADERPGPPHLQRRRPRAVRPPGAVLHAARGVRDGGRARRSSASSRGSSPRRATRR